MLISKTKQLNGLILSRKNWLENDRIISFYSQEEGKIDILARSSRKIESKLGPVISEPFVLLRVTVASGKKFFHLIGVEARRHFKKILKSETKLIKINDIFNQIDALIKFQKKDAKIYFLTAKFLETVEKISEIKLKAISSAFLIKFLAFSGYKPEVRNCLVCHQEPKENPIYFIFNKGGIVCVKHLEEADQSAQKEKISLKNLEVLQKLLYRNFDSLATEMFSEKEIDTVDKIIVKFFNWHLD
jgi:DNA repair protein RecO (recombination protein O)